MAAIRAISAILTTGNVAMKCAALLKGTRIAFKEHQVNDQMDRKEHKKKHARKCHHKFFGEG